MKLVMKYVFFIFVIKKIAKSRIIPKYPGIFKNQSRLASLYTLHNTPTDWYPNNFIVLVFHTQVTTLLLTIPYILNFIVFYCIVNALWVLKGEYMFEDFCFLSLTRTPKDTSILYISMKYKKFFKSVVFRLGLLNHLLTHCYCIHSIIFSSNRNTIKVIDIKNKSPNIYSQRKKFTYTFVCRLVFRCIFCFCFFQ